jgi:hypothetical protein
MSGHGLGPQTPLADFMSNAANNSHAGPMRTAMQQSRCLIAPAFQNRTAWSIAWPRFDHPYLRCGGPESSGKMPAHGKIIPN